MEHYLEAWGNPSSYDSSLHSQSNPSSCEVAGSVAAPKNLNIRPKNPKKTKHDMNSMLTVH